MNTKAIFVKGVELITNYQDFVQAVKASQTEYIYDENAKKAAHRLGVTAQNNRNQYLAWLQRMRREFGEQKRKNSN